MNAPKRGASPVSVDFIDVGGVSTRILTSGSVARRSLVLLHGVGLSADMWLPNLEELGEKYHVVAPDLLWHGFTHAEPADINSAPHPVIMEHLRGLFTHLDLQRPVLIGSSFGGLLSLLLHLESPAMYEALVVVGSGSSFDEGSDVAQMLGQAHANALNAMKAGSLTAWRQRLSTICHPSAELDERILLPLAIAYAEPSQRDCFDRFMRSRRAKDHEDSFQVRDRLADIEVPVLAVWGRQDIRGKVESAKRAVGIISRSELVEYDQCGHLPPLEQPARFNSDVDAFLSSLDASHNGGKEAI